MKDSKCLFVLPGFTVGFSFILFLFIFFFGNLAKVLIFLPEGDRRGCVVAHNLHRGSICASADIVVPVHLPNPLIVSHLN